MSDYATTTDIIESGRTLTADEMTIASKKITEASAMIRRVAKATGRDFDEMIADDSDLSLVANSVVVSCVIRYLNDSKTDPALSQISQSAGGYSFSGTLANSGARLNIWNSEWALLGLKRQKVGTLEVFDYGADD